METNDQLNMRTIGSISPHNAVVNYALYGAKQRGLNELETLVFVIKAMHDIYIEQRNLLSRYESEFGPLHDTSEED